MSLKLQDKTIVLSGTFDPLMQNLASTLTGFGADIALIGPNVTQARRFSDSLNDAREIDPNFGRSMIVEASLTDESSVQEALSRTAESFGGLDALIDSTVSHSTGLSFSSSTAEQLLGEAQAVLHRSLITAQKALKFIECRQKGRVIFLVQDSWRWSLPGEEISSVFRSCLQQLTKVLAQEITEKNITINAVALGVTEPFLRERFPNAPSIEQALTELKKHCPQARLVENQDISHLVAFLASPLSSAISGQTLTANGGWI